LCPAAKHDKSNGQLPDFPRWRRLVEADYLSQIEALGIDGGFGRMRNFSRGLVFIVVG
jgi:hypothetical protein